MNLATSFFEWLHRHLGKCRCGKKIYLFCLFIYQHLIYYSKRIRRRKKAPSTSIGLYYFDRGHNFGDCLNEDLLRQLGIEFSSVPIEEADCICIGSILDELLLTESRTLRFRKPVKVFGAGFMMCREDANEKFNRPVTIFILRGKLSLERCKMLSNSDLNEVVLGDPGLLVKRIFPEVKREHCYDVGIICHMNDKCSSYLGNIRFKKKSVVFIDIFLPTREFVAQVAKCDFILSSALHGLICADALGIPNKWLVISGNVEGNGYKFRDYYSVFDKSDVPIPVDIRQTVIKDEYIERLHSEYKSKEVQIDRICERLENAFEKLKTMGCSS